MPTQPATEETREQAKTPSLGDTSTRRKEPPTLWEVLNSQFTLWLLGVVLVSVIPWWWNYWTGQRLKQEQAAQKVIDDAKKADLEKLEAQRQDSQFLVTLLPYLTASDIRVELRAVRVIQSRYPGGDTPSHMEKLIADVLQNAASIPEKDQNDETKRLVMSVFHGADVTNPLQDKAATAQVKRLPARVYLQIFDEDARSMASAIQSRLRGKGFIVPGIENVKGRVQVLKNTEVRFYNDSDSEDATNIQQLLIQSGFRDTTVARLNMKANPGTIEVWLPTRK